DRDDARRLVRQTLDFWRAHLEPMEGTRPRIADGPPDARAIMEALYGNDPRAADTLLAGWVRTHPRDGDGQRHHARVLAGLRRFPESTAAYERAYALDPEDPGTLSGLGMARNGQQRWQEAADLLGRAVALG